MRDEFRDLSDFYASRGGRVAARLLRRRIGMIWPDLTRQRVLGLGHTQPFLSLWQRQATLCIAGEGRPVSQPALLASCSCVLREDSLPFPDLSFDRVLLSHALETSLNAPRLLRNVWRVLKDDGRLLIVMPNRRGIWAHLERTPFGQGAPATRRQIDRLLAGQLFRIERTEGALWLPPADLRPLLRMGDLVERTGARLAPQLPGVLLIEAVKDVYGVVPAGKPVRRRVMVPAG